MGFHFPYCYEPIVDLLIEHWTLRVFFIQILYDLIAVPNDRPIGIDEDPEECIRFLVLEASTPDPG